MTMRTFKLNQKGYTLVELAIVTVVLAVMATTVIVANRFLNKQAVNNADQTFATEKAIQMYEELRALVNGNEQLGVAVLDNYTNGSNFDKVLTTDNKVDTGLPTADPGDALSGNIKSNGHWRYMRQVEVNRLANDVYGRQVTVRVYLYPGDFAGPGAGPLLATVGGIMRTSAQPYQPTQVMDLYILQINNIPAWWAVLPTLSGYMQSAIADLQSRLPALQLRTHYITRSSYGRDIQYMPNTNSSASPSETFPQKWVYFYPGFVPQDGVATDFYYYDPSTGGDPNSLLMTGNFMVDGASYPVSTSQFSNANFSENVDYATADQYNNAMRYPDELLAYQAVTQAATNFVNQGGVPEEGVTEISERMLLEGMLSQPASFQNAMIINLHGELLPLPPLRNYSDAAKDPANQLSLTTNPLPMTCAIAPSNGVSGNTNVRVVTHPELLYYPGGAVNSTSVTVRLRVYAYYDSEDTGGVLPPGDPRVPAISLFLPDANASVVGVTAIVGNGSSPRAYNYKSPPGPYNAPYLGTVPSDDPAAAPGPMQFAVNQVGPGGQQTLITLYNTPLRCASAGAAPTPSVLGQPDDPNAQAQAQPQVGCGAVAYDNDTEGEATGGSVGKGVTFNHTVNGTNPLLLVQVETQNENDGANVPSVNTCTYNGVSLTKATSTTWSHGDMETWYLVNPPTGASHQVIVKTAANSPETIHVAALSFDNVDQTHPIGATTTDTANNNTSETLNLTTQYNYSTMVGFLTLHSSSAITTGTLQTQEWIYKDGSASEGDIMPTSGNAGSYAVTYTWGGANHSLGVNLVEIVANGCYGNTPTKTNTPIFTSTFTITPTNTPIFSSTFTRTPTATNTPVPVVYTSTFTNTPTPVFTNTPAPTATATNIPGGGLNSADMLYGSEYIPCSPDMKSGGSNLTTTTYINNSYTFTGSDLTNPVTTAGTPKNTARWIISIAMPVTSVFGSAITINGNAYAMGATFSPIGQHAIETRLGMGVTTSAVTMSGGGVSMIYPNLSRTYVWCGDATTPPYTEQYQFMGDPRDCPYFDVKVGGVSIVGAAITIGPNGYNWWFKNGNSTQMYSDGYRGFDAGGANSQWNGNKVGIDLPRYNQIIRQGLLNSTSIWTTTNGWSFYYYGIGGEIGFDHAPMASGVKINSAPFQTSMAGTVLNGYDSINGGGRSGASPAIGLWVASNITGSSGVTWYQRSWLGELYPDKSYLNSWVTYGNLPSVANTTPLLPETFYLQTMQNVNIPSTGGKSNDGFNSQTYYPNPTGNGCESFFNGVNGGNPYQHAGGGTTGTETSLGVTTYNIYQFALANSVSVQRPWYFGSGTPPEWNSAPYNLSSMRPALDCPSTLTSGADTNSRVYYTNDADATKIGSGVVRMTVTNSSGVTQVGYVVETGTAPSGSVGAQTLAETALVYAMRTFLDGGQMAVTGSPGHIVQIPLIKIFPVSAIPQYSESQTIAVTIASPVTALANGGGAVSVGMPVTDIWWRFNANGLANYYTEEYPNYGQAMTGTGMYQESVSVVYNLKYSPDTGKTWYYVQDPSDNNNLAVTGVCNNNPAYAITLAAPWVYNFPVTASDYTLSQGSYLLLAEAYRQNFGQHYAYDEYNFQVSW